MRVNPVVHFLTSYVDVTPRSIDWAAYLLVGEITFFGWQLAFIRLPLVFSLHWVIVSLSRVLSTVPVNAELMAPRSLADSALLALSSPTPDFCSLHLLLLSCPDRGKITTLGSLSVLLVVFFTRPVYLVLCLVLSFCSSLCSVSIG